MNLFFLFCMNFFCIIFVIISPKLNANTMYDWKLTIYHTMAKEKYQFVMKLCEFRFKKAL